MTRNERFKLAIAHLRSLGLIGFGKDLAPLLKVNEDRIRSLTKTKGPKLDAEEIILLRNNFSQINWDWVVIGEGQMLSSERNESDIFTGNAEKEALLRQILARTCELPVEERENLLIDEVLRLQQQLAKAAEISQSSLFEELKRKLGGA